MTEGRQRRVGLVALGILQALLVAALLAGPGELATAPFRSLDYGAHFYGALHMAHRLRASGAFWGYDPWWVAGYPDGQVGLIDNKLFAALLLGAPRGFEALIFNGGVLGILLSIPWLIALASRLAGDGPREATGAALAAVVGMFAVPVCVFFWTWGGVSFFFASVLAVPVAVAVATTLTEGSLFSARGAAAALGAMTVVFVHPVGALMLLAGALPVVWSGPRPLGRRLRDLGLLGLLLVLPVLPVVEVTLSLRGQLRPFAPWVHETFRGGFRQLKLDWWTHLFDTRAIPNGAGGLLVLMLLAAFGGWRGKSLGPNRSARAADLAILLGALGAAAATYVVPSLIGRFTALQPLRFLISLCFFACVPAGRGIVRAVDLLIERRPVVWLSAILAAFVIGNSVRGFALLLVLGHGSDAAERELVPFLERETTGDDRILVESTGTGLLVTGPFWRVIDIMRFGLLPLRIPREFLGSTATTPFTAHRYAKFIGGDLFGYEVARLGDDDLRALLARYGVSWAVACSASALGGLRSHPSIFEDTAAAAECRVFRVREPERSRLLEGEGRVHADVDRIEVTEARGERLVLKYHWVPNLRTEPPLLIVEAPQPGAPVGFIAVWPEGVRSFTILPRGPLETLGVSPSRRLGEVRGGDAKKSAER